ncbi:MAG TPA: hypothetical protein VGC23_07395 [Vicinamibacterales bacterium]
MNVLRIALIVTLGVSSTACSQLYEKIFKSPTEPSTSDVRSYLGTWAGSTVAPVAQTCGSLQWKITSQTGGQASGDFSAACADGVSLAGTMTATHGDTSIPWAATGTATKGTVTCPFSMTGTGTFQGTSNILINYAGTSCNGPVSGSETIKR